MFASIDFNTIGVLLVLGLAGVGLLWRTVSKDSHERFKDQAPGAFLSWLSRRMK